MLLCTLLKKETSCFCKEPVDQRSSFSPANIHKYIKHNTVSDRKVRQPTLKNKTGFCHLKHFRYISDVHQQVSSPAVSAFKTLPFSHCRVSASHADIMKSPFENLFSTANMCMHLNIQYSPTVAIPHLNSMDTYLLCPLVQAEYHHLHS